VLLFHDKRRHQVVFEASSEMVVCCAAEEAVPVVRSTVAPTKVLVGLTPATVRGTEFEQSEGDPSGSKPVELKYKPGTVRSLERCIYLNLKISGQVYPARSNVRASTCCAVHRCCARKRVLFGWTLWRVYGVVQSAVFSSLAHVSPF
jgi:hypothetical protein